MQKSICPVFGQCGGCAYQDISYEEELCIKEELLKSLFTDITSENVFESIVASPRFTHYRHRMDFKLVRTRENKILIGFTPKEKRGILPIEDCLIADEPIAQFIPELKQQAIAKLPEKYRNANLVVRTGDEGRVSWGGIGKRSLRMDPKDYMWTEVSGRKVFYAMETFFQANLSILPKLFEHLSQFNFLNKETVLFDLYGGVGLFGIGLYDQVKKVILIEENKASLTLARYNVQFHQLPRFEIKEGRVEDQLPQVLTMENSEHQVAIIDPPRAGLSPKSLEFFKNAKTFQHILYLSCNPESLARDLAGFCEAGWAIRKVTPFDFFPRTKHVETLVVLEAQN